MTHEEIDILWHKAMHDSIAADEMFTRYRFAALVANAEREACAQLCEKWDSMRWSGAPDAIRARSEK